MEDRERIAELIGSEHYYYDDWERIKTGNQPNVSPKDAQWVFDVADRIIRILPELGYTRPAEPAENVAEDEYWSDNPRILTVSELWDAYKNHPTHYKVIAAIIEQDAKTALSILKLCQPELKMLDMVEEDVIETIINFYVPDNRKRFVIDVWQQFRKRIAHDQQTFKGG